MLHFDGRETMAFHNEESFKDNYKLAVEIASIPDQIRGFGYIKNIF